METDSPAVYPLKNILYSIFVLFLLYLTRLYSYLLFHSIAEIFCIVIAFGMFMFTWNAKEFIKNNYILFIGIAYLFIGSIDIVHTLAYKGMGVFQEYDANLSVQLWMAARYTESITLLIAPLLMTRHFKVNRIFYSYFFLTVILLVSIFYWNIFPVCFVDGVGLTPFKKVSEYIICLILLGSLYLLFKKRDDFDLSIYRLLCISIILTIVSEFAFTFYIDVYGFSNLVGHLFKIISFYLIYKAIIYTGLKKPYHLMFKEMGETEEALKKSEEKYRALYSNAPLSYQSLNEDGCFLDINPAWLRTLGYEQEEVVGKWFGDFLHPDSRPHFEKNFPAFKKRGYVRDVQFKIRHKDGRYLDISFEGCIGYTPDGKFKQTYCVFQDITERKQAEEALKINEKRLQLALEGADLGMWDWDMQTNDVYLSPRYLSMLGYGPTELPHTLTTWENLLHPDDRELVKQLIFNCIEKGSGKWDVEFRLRHKGGQYLWISGHGKIVGFSQDGSPTRATGVHRDITSRKIGEEELRDREERFRELFNNMSSGVAIYEAVEEGDNFIFKDLNRAGLLSSQIELREIVGKQVTEIFPSIKEMGLFDVFQRVYKTGIPEHFPSSFYQDDRLNLWVENYVCKIPSGEIVAIYDDITDRKKSEEELIRAKEEWEKTFDAIPDIVTIQDKDLRIVKANKAAAEFFAIEQNELIGQKCYEIFCGSQEPCPGCPGVVAIHDINSHSEIIEHQKLKKTFQVSSSPLLDSNNEIQYIVHLARDITEQKKMEEEIFKARKLESVGILAGGIAHDFNNILAAILGNISLALTITNPEDEIYELLADSEKASLRAKDLTQQLLTFSKGGEPVKKIAAIDEVIKDSANFVLRGSNIRCNFNFSKDLWPVVIDTGQISQVIQNIVINASQAMPSGGIIKIDCINHKFGLGGNIPIRPGDYIKIVIKDQGIGISPEMLEKVFDPYFTTKQKGSGLGLAITHSIVRKHGGYIAVDSKLDQGTTVTIYLPASQRKPELEPKDVFVPPATAQGRIMIMDDEEMIRNLVERALSRIGYEVVSAEDGDAAVRLYREAKEAGAPIDLIIMDLTIPGGLGGKDAIKEIHKIDPAAKVIVSSGYSNDPVMANFSEYGFCGAMVKPFQMQELMKVVGKTVSS